MTKRERFSYDVSLCGTEYVCYGFIDLDGRADIDIVMLKSINEPHNLWDAFAEYDIGNDITKECDDYLARQAALPKIDDYADAPYSAISDQKINEPWLFPRRVA